MNDCSRSRRRFMTALGAAALFARAASASSTTVGTSRAWVPGLQLYTLGLTPRDDLASVFKAVAAIGYRSVELAGHYDRTPEQLRGLFKQAGLICPSIHLAPRPLPGMWDLQSDAAKLLGHLEALGVRYAVLPIPLLPDRIYDVLLHPPAGGLDGPAASRLFASLEADDWKRTADLLNEKAAVLARAGIRLAYHNHGVDFSRLPSDTSGYRLLLERTDPKLVDFELDTGWAAAAGEDIGKLMDRLGPRLKLMHLKDAKARLVGVMELASADVGIGIVHWDALVARVRAMRIEHLFVEQEPPFARTPMDSARVAYRFLDDLFARSRSAGK